MQNLKWYYLLGIAIGLIALGAVVYWIFCTSGLLSRLNTRNSEQIEAGD